MVFTKVNNSIYELWSLQLIGSINASQKERRICALTENDERAEDAVVVKGNEKFGIIKEREISNIQKLNWT